MGFTPINGPGMAPKADVPEDVHSSSDILTTPSDHTQYRSAALAASEYLGRGETDDVAPVNHALHGPGVKKTNARSRKRSEPTTSSAKTKRRKTSDASDEILTAKPVAKKARAKTRVADSSGKGAPAPEPLPAHLEIVDDGTMDHPATQSTAIFSTPTSMHITGSPAKQTSMDALRATKGRTKTLYRCEEASDPSKPNVNYSQPWLSHRLTAASQHDQSGLLQPGTAPSPRNADHRESDKPGSSTYSEEDELELASANTGVEDPLLIQRQSSAVSEDLYADGINDVDIVAFADHVVDQSTAGAVPNGRLAKPQLRILSTSSNESAFCARTRPTFGLGRQVTPILTADEDYVVYDNGEDAEKETIDLRGADEESFVHQSPIPETRDWKLNMREVDKNEDYGGLLLSDGEREYLGKMGFSPDIFATDASLRTPQIVYFEQRTHTHRTPRFPKTNPRPFFRLRCF
jgi:hypothetical protein